MNLVNSADIIHRAAGRVLASLLAWPPARLGRVLKTRNGQQSILHSPSCPLTSPSFSCSLSKPAPRHCCWSSVAIIAEPQSSSAAVPVAPVLLRLLGPRPAYLHHQAHVVWLSFERRALPYMAAAVSAALTPRPSWPGSLWPCCALGQPRGLPLECAHQHPGAPPPLHHRRRAPYDRHRRAAVPPLLPNPVRDCLLEFDVSQGPSCNVSDSSE